jgi:hypothetical protein
MSVVDSSPISVHAGAPERGRRTNLRQRTPIARTSRPEPQANGLHLSRSGSGLSCRAEGQLCEVSLIGCHAVAASFSAGDSTAKNNAVGFVDRRGAYCDRCPCRPGGAHNACDAAAAITERPFSIIECSAFGRIKTLSRPESGRGLCHAGRSRCRRAAPPAKARSIAERARRWAADHSDPVPSNDDYPF